MAVISRYARLTIAGVQRIVDLLRQGYGRSPYGTSGYGD